MHDNQALYTLVTPESNEIEIIVMPLANKAFSRAISITMEFLLYGPSNNVQLLHSHNVLQNFSVPE